jgi:hypothetical protein
MNMLPTISVWLCLSIGSADHTLTPVERAIDHNAQIEPAFAEESREERLERLLSNFPMSWSVEDDSEGRLGAVVSMPQRYLPILERMSPIHDFLALHERPYPEQQALFRRLARTQHLITLMDIPEGWDLLARWYIELDTAYRESSDSAQRESLRGASSGTLSTLRVPHPMVRAYLLDHLEDMEGVRFRTAVRAIGETYPDDEELWALLRRLRDDSTARRYQREVVEEEFWRAESAYREGEATEVTVNWVLRGLPHGFGRAGPDEQARIDAIVADPDRFLPILEDLFPIHGLRASHTLPYPEIESLGRRLGIARELIRRMDTPEGWDLMAEWFVAVDSAYRDATESDWRYYLRGNAASSLSAIEVGHPTVRAYLLEHLAEMDGRRFDTALSMIRDHYAGDLELLELLRRLEGESERSDLERRRISGVIQRMESEGPEQQDPRQHPEP